MFDEERIIREVEKFTHKDSLILRRWHATLCKMPTFGALAPTPLAGVERRFVASIARSNALAATPLAGVERRFVASILPTDQRSTPASGVAAKST